jgi:hypothetical protein
MINLVKTKRTKTSGMSIAARLTGRVILLACVLCFSTMGKSETQDGANAAALAQLRGLAGEWEGSFEWTGARTATGKMNATYYSTGNGSAVVENLTVDGVPSMTSVYHLDGADLRMTHYCAAQNQPRLKARQIDLAKGILDLDFVDAPIFVLQTRLTSMGLRCGCSRPTTLLWRSYLKEPASVARRSSTSSVLPISRIPITANLHEKGNAHMHHRPASRQA